MQAAGTSYSIPRLVSALSEERVEASLYSIGESSLNNKLDLKFAPNLSAVPALRRLGLSRDLKRAVFLEALTSDVVHGHGLWRMANLYAAEGARRAMKPFVVSTHGMLSPHALKISKYIKQLFWIMGQYEVLNSASCLHATSEQEYLDIRAAGIAGPVAVIPFGIDVDPDPVQSAKEGRIMLYLGRLHPIKNIEMLIEAWALVEARHPDWILRFVGAGDDIYRSQLVRFSHKLGLQRVQFHGPLYGPEKREAYRRAEAFVLSSHSENFGITVAESLAECTPVICGKGAPWSGIQTNRCGFWIDNTIGSFAAALDSMMSLSSSERHSMGERGRAWMIREHGWQAVARRMMEVYRFVALGGDVPDCVRIS